MVKLRQTPAEARDDRFDVPPQCEVSQTGTVASDSCTFGDPEGTRRVALVGDSHAKQWLPAVHEIALKKHWKVWLWEKPSCPFIPLTVQLDVFRGDYPTCATYHDSVLSRIQELGPFDAVIVGHFSGYPRHLGTADNESLSYDEAVEAWGPAWESMSRRLHEVSKRVVVIHDTPRGPRDVPSCLSEHVKDTTECMFGQRGALADADALYDAEVAAAKDTTKFVDLTPLLCPDRVCPVIWNDGSIIYRDSHHLTATVSRSLAPALLSRLKAVLGGKMFAGSGG
jgi:hypothetical protein